MLKILISRRGRATPREILADMLWPEADPETAGRRLSVTLSTLRAVLDPERRFEADRFVRGGRDLVGLDLSHVDVDVERFLALAESGREALRGGQTLWAARLLSEAASMYRGDFLDEEAYEEYPAMLRDRARCMHVAVQRDLVTIAGDVDRAVTHLLQILEVDPYDEDAHIDLVRRLFRARQHGQAQRFYRSYVARMRDIGITPAAYDMAIGAAQAS